LNGAKVRTVIGTLVDVLPPVEVRVGNQNPYMLIDSAGSGTRSVKVVVTNHLSTNIAAAQISIAPCRNGHDGLMLGSQRVSLAKLERRELEIPLRINSADGITGSANGDAGAPPYIEVVRIDDTNKQPQGPLGGSECFVVSAAHAQVAPNLRVGYIRGFDYSLPNALNTLGVESKELSVDEVKTADLSNYSSIIVDNRVYESQPELIAANQKLFDYANAGGNLIVFYHKSDEWNPDPRRNRPQLAPYKLVLGNERITDENAPITFIEPKHPLLNSPNRIGPDDFKDWIQERGLYYPKDWDPQFHALLQSNDPGEAPLKGGLLVGDYGRGHYIYTSMVWYRQLRAGVPGAYRMLANMISYGHGK